MKHEELHEIRKMTRRGYQDAQAAEIQKAEKFEGSRDDMKTEMIARAAALGYSADDLGLLPEGINVDEACANPLAGVKINEPSAVIVVGCRTGADCFLAAARVGDQGQVVGVEENQVKVTAAREAARKNGVGSIEIRPGENENLPAADKAFDVAVTNCSVTFSFDKPRVIGEILRVIKPGGQIVLCEPVLARTAAPDMRKTVKGYLECLENAFYADDYRTALKRAGFKKIKIIDETVFPLERMKTDSKAQAKLLTKDISEEDVEAVAYAVTSIVIVATRP